MKRSKTYVIDLGYFKQGDDLYHFLKCKGDDVVLALKEHSECMKSVSDHLKQLVEEIKKIKLTNTFEISLEADDIELISD